MFSKLLINIGLVLLFFAPFPSDAQDMFTDIRKCREVYQSAKTFQCEVDIKIYQAGETGPALSRRCFISRKGAKYLYTLDNLVLLLNSDYSIMVMKDKKSMLIKKQDSSRKNEDKLFNADLDVMSMDSLFRIAQNNTRSEYLGNNNGRRIYKAYFEDGYYRSATLYIDEKLSYLSRMTFEYNKSISGVEASTDVNFKNVQINGPVSDSLFLSEKYIRKSKSGVLPAPEYQAYQVYDAAEF